MTRRWFAALGLLGLAALAAAQNAPDAREIRFEPGARSTVVSGAVVRGDRDVYAFSARKGQTTEVSVKSVESNAVISVWRPGAQIGASPGNDIQGTALPGAGERADATRWRGRLPETGRYLIVVGPTRGNASYELRLSIGAPSTVRPAAPKAELPPK